MNESLAHDLVTAISCGEAPHVSHANFESSVLFPGQSLKYTCTQSKHRFADGYRSKFIYCNKHGEFKGIDSNCRGIEMPQNYDSVELEYLSLLSFVFLFGETAINCLLLVVSAANFHRMCFSQSLSAAGIT